MAAVFHRYVLPSGAEIEIENLAPSGAGVRDVAASSATATTTGFEKAIEPLGELCELLLGKIKSGNLKPTNITLELGFALKGKTQLVLVAGETEATLKVKLEWSGQ